jgi:hypothetical protein
MLRDIKKAALLSAAVAGFAVLGLGSSVRADLIVDYYTTGSFSYSATGSPSLGSSATIGDVADGFSTITFSPIVGGVADLVPTPAINPTELEDAESLGELSTASTAPQPQTFDTLYFTLDVYQTSPSGGPGVLAATMGGSLQEGTGHAAGVISVDFSTYTTYLTSVPPVTYTLDDPTFTINDFNGGSTLDAVITSAVPLPKAASTGLALLGCVSAFSVIRRRVMA